MALRSVTLLKTSRLEYGGRNSILVSLVPLLVLALVASLGYGCGVHGSFSSLFMLWTGCVGACVGLFSLVSLWEYASMGTVLFSASGLECVAWLVLFEVCFFAGVAWCLGIISVHAVSEVGLRGVDLWSGSSDWDGSLWSSSSILSSLPSSLLIAESCLPSLVSLVILLLVTLLLQIVHRSSIILYSVLLTRCSLED